MASLALGVRPRQFELKITLGTPKYPAKKFDIGIFHWANALNFEVNTRNIGVLDR